MKSVPDPATFGGSKTAIRRQIENEFYSTNYYERLALARKREGATTEFEKRVWRSLAPAWKDAAIQIPRGERPSSPSGNLPVTTDFEELSVRFLYDYKRMNGPAYLPVIKRLLQVDPSNYRLLIAAYDSCFWVGTDGPASSPGYADRVRDVRPNDPCTTILMCESYFYRIAYQLGDVDENYRKYLDWVRLGKKITQGSGSQAAQEDYKKITSYAHWAAELVAKQKKKGG